jgi:hypothetical protein
MCRLSISMFSFLWCEVTTALRATSMPPPPLRTPSLLPTITTPGQATGLSNPTVICHDNIYETGGVYTSEKGARTGSVNGMSAADIRAEYGYGARFSDRSLQLPGACAFAASAPLEVLPCVWPKASPLGVVSTLTAVR